MIQTVEKAFDVQINHPGRRPASLPRHPHRVECRLARSIAVGVRMEYGFHQRLQDHLRDRLNTLSATVGMPKRRVPPLSFSISTRRTGGGKYDPDDVRFQTLYRLPSGL